MDRRPCYIDASTFLGMHHIDPVIRGRCLAFFRTCFRREVRMNLEQVGLCDAIIWRHPRALQDCYYPFMDRLHSDMQILRQGYNYQDLAVGLNEFRQMGLRPDQALLLAQVVRTNGCLYTQDPRLRDEPSLEPYLGSVAALDPGAWFPEQLETLYQQSMSLTVTEEDWQHVEQRYSDPARDAA